MGVETFTAGALARAARVPTSTVRYYERLRLLRPAFAFGPGARRFDADALARLRFVRAAQRTGFTLEDIAALLKFRDPDGRACRDVQRLISRRLEDLELRLRDLRHVQSALRTTLRRCRSQERMGRCQLIEGLRDGCCEKNT